MRKPTQESALKRALRTPQYRMRVCRDRTKYQRHEKHKQAYPKSDFVFFVLFYAACLRKEIPRLLHFR
jgi:hypothetical protein